MSALRRVRIVRVCAELIFLSCVVLFVATCWFVAAVLMGY